MDPTADKADGSRTNGVKRALVGWRKHMLVDDPHMYVSNIRTYAYQGRLRTGGAAAENNFLFCFAPQHRRS